MSPWQTEQIISIEQCDPCSPPIDRIFAKGQMKMFPPKRYLELASLISLVLFVLQKQSPCEIV